MHAPFTTFQFCIHMRTILAKAHLAFSMSNYGDQVHLTHQNLHLIDAKIANMGQVVRLQCGIH